jgi:hypothetical protein
MDFRLGTVLSGFSFVKPLFCLADRFEILGDFLRSALPSHLCIRRDCSNTASRMLRPSFKRST